MPVETCTFDINHSDADLVFLQEVLYSQVAGRTLLANPLHLSARAASSPSKKIKDANLVSQWVSNSIRNPLPENLPHLSSNGGNPSVLGLAIFAAQILTKLKLSGQSQSVLVRGSNSFDKWSQVQGLVNHLLDVSSKKNSIPVHSKITSAMRVLGSFIHSSSQDNPNVPFGGLCIELLVDEKHRITGAQFLDYMVHPEFSKGSSNILPSSNLLHMLMEGSSSKVSSRLSLLSTSKSSIKDATSKFTEFLEDLTSLGIKDNTQEAVLDILGAIYHLCLLKFIPSGSESNPTLVSNPEVLMLLSTLLHVPPEQLELILLSRTKEVKGERFTKLLSPDEALLRAKDFAETLYVLLFKWILEFINAKLTKKFKKSPPHTCISILHFPDFQSNSKAFSEWNDLVRYASDCFDFFSVSDAIRSHSFFAQYNVPTSPFKLMLPFSENPIYDKSRISTKHFNSIVSYDLLHLFNSNCASNFVQDLFRITSLSIALDEGRSGEIQGKPLRRPFLKVKKLKKSSAISTSKQLSFVDLQSALEELFSGMQSSHVHYFFCHFDSKVQSFLQQLKMFPNKGTFELFVSYDQLVSRYNQLFSMHSINEDLSSPVKVRTLLSAIKVKDSLFDATHGVWLSWEGMFLIEVHYRLFRDWKKASEEFDSNQDSYSESNFSASKDSFDVTSDNFDIFLANSQLDLKSDAGTARNRRANRTVSVYSTMSDQSSPNSEETFVSDRSPAPRKIKGLHAPEPVLPKPLPEKKKDPLRQRWVTLVKILTFWVPNILLSFFGKNSPESLMAWKEKFAIFMFIIFTSLFTLFAILYSSIVICPRKNYFSPYELNWLSSNPNITVSSSNPLRIYAAIRGSVYNLGEVSNDNSFHSEFIMRQLQGMDLSSGFPADLTRYCGALMKNPSTFRFAQQSNAFNPIISANHAKGGDSTSRSISNFLSSRKKGVYALTFDDILTGWTSKALETPLKRFIFKGKVYDLTDYYLTTAINTADRFLGFEFKLSGSSETFKLDQYISQRALEGKVDFSNDVAFNNLWGSTVGARECIENTFHTAYIDDRRSLKCMFTNYTLFALSMVLSFVIFVKFLSALFMSRTVQVPAKMDKFVMVQVPCYTEDEATLRNTLDSLAFSDYDDKKKLLVFICDGMIVGRGNDRPTPNILLELLGVDPTVHVPSFSYQALGEGRMQHNLAKLYSGLYEHRGHLVPYMVIIKLGLSSEAVKPGNRGKRDSQMLLMRFLNKIHNEHPMSPLELEMRFQLQYIIGVDPAWYEYLLMVDADTVVNSTAITQLIAYCMTDMDIIGCCGETRLTNEKQSFVTMIQVYEYFISHHLSKAFESWFGTVTCLPGCFSMYRVFSARKNKPILASDQIIREYGDNHVNTLHEKNLLVLGEDRYLTTLILKAFPKMKTKFVPAALANTIAPESFSVLMSQRRRWINSTFHNLVELTRLSNLCGFFLFSMRFVVFMELLATIIQPATVVYLVYMMYLIIDALVRGFPLDTVLISIIVLMVVYGLQIIIFVIRKEFSHIIWMLFYLLSIPFFGFFVPLYSFWHMDDFSWGSTRKLNVADDSEGHGTNSSTSDSNYFDVANEIPHYSWNVYMKHREEGSSKEIDFSDSISMVRSNHTAVMR